MSDRQLALWQSVQASSLFLFFCSFTILSQWMNRNLPNCCSLNVASQFNDWTNAQEKQKMGRTVFRLRNERALTISIGIVQWYFTALIKQDDFHFKSMVPTYSMSYSATEICSELHELPFWNFWQVSLKYTSCLIRRLVFYGEASFQSNPHCWECIVLSLSQGSDKLIRL